MSIRRKYLVSVANQLTQALVLALIMLMVARRLGPAGKGTVALILALPTMLATVTHLSLQRGMTYYASSGRLSLGVLAANALAFVAVLGSLVAAGTWWWRDALMGVLHLDFDPTLWRWVVLLLFPTYLVEFGSGLLLGARQFGRLAVANAGTSLFFLLVFLAVLWEGGSVGTVCMLFVVFRTVRALALWAAIPWSAAGPVRGSVGAFGDAVKYGLQGHLGRIFQIAVYRLDLILLNALVGPVATGLYAAATFFSEALGHVPQALGAVVLPESAALEADARRSLAARVCRQTVWFMVPVCAVVAVLAPWLVPFLFGAAFRPAVVAVWFLLPGMVALAASRVILPAVAGGGWPWAGSYSGALALGLTVAGDLLLIPRWGAAGAAAASTIAYTVQFFFGAAIFRMQTRGALVDLVAFRLDDFRGLVAAIRRGSGG